MWISYHSAKVFPKKHPRKIDKMLPIVNQQELEREQRELLFVYFSA